MRLRATSLAFNRASTTSTSRRSALNGMSMPSPAVKSRPKRRVSLSAETRLRIRNPSSVRGASAGGCGSDLPVLPGVSEGDTHSVFPSEHEAARKEGGGVQTMTLQAQAPLGQRWPDQKALWAGLDARRTMLNQHIPRWVETLAHCLTGQYGGALGSLVSPRMGSGDARPGSRLCE